MDERRLDPDDPLQRTDEVDAAEERLERRAARLRRGGAVVLAIAGSAGAAALPGGIGYALAWAGGFLIAGGILSIPGLREVRALKAERDRLAARPDSQRLERGSGADPPQARRAPPARGTDP